MKKIVMSVVLILLMSMDIQAESRIEYVKKENNDASVIMDNELILIYDKKENRNNQIRLETLQNNLKKDICSNKEIRALIVEEHMNLKFIYLGDDDVIVAKIDSCAGVDVKESDT